MRNRPSGLYRLLIANGNFSHNLPGKVTCRPDKIYALAPPIVARLFPVFSGQAPTNPPPGIKVPTDLGLTASLGALFLRLSRAGGEFCPVTGDRFQRRLGGCRATGAHVVLQAGKAVSSKDRPDLARLHLREELGAEWHRHSGPLRRPAAQWSNVLWSTWVASFLAFLQSPAPLALGRRRCRLAITVGGTTSPLQRLVEVLGFVNVGDGKYHEFEFHVHDVTSRSVGRTVRPYASRCACRPIATSVK
jgi:hypothetical protein